MKTDGTAAICTVAPIFEDGTGKIGIGTVLPTNKLHVMGSVMADNVNTYQSASLTNDGGIELYRSPLGSSPTVNGFIDFKSSSSSDTDFRISYDSALHNKGAIKFSSTPGGNVMNVFRNGQVAVGTSAPDSSALLDLSSSSKGLLIPRVALTGTTDITTIVGALTSLQVYNTATAGVAPNNVIPGFYYWNGTKWVSLSGGSGGKDWGLLGNAGTTVTNFLGTTDNVSLRFRTNNTQKMIIDSVGNVGIGTTTPSENLEVAAGFKRGDIRHFTLSRMLGNTIGDWVNIGSFSSNAIAGYTKIKFYAHGNSIISIGEVELSEIAYSNGARSTDWIELPLSAANTQWTDNQYIAVDVKSANRASATEPVSVRLRAKAGWGTAVPVTMIVETNAPTFTASSTSGTGATVSAGYLGAHQWMFPVSTTDWTITKKGLFVNSNGNVGVGAITPLTKLHVYDSTATVGENLVGTFGKVDGSVVIGYINDSAGTETAGLIRSRHSVNLVLGTTANTVNALSISGTTGNVGVGTTTAAARLEVQKTSAGAITDAMVLSNPVASIINTGVALHFQPNGASGLARTARIVSRQTTAGNFADLGFFTAPGGDPEERVTITANGDVGIGTTTPSVANGYLLTGKILNLKNLLNPAVLSVEGSYSDMFLISSLAAANEKWMVLRGSLGVTSFIAHNDNGTSKYNMLSLNHGSGYVGIGTTVPSEKLEVCGNVKVIGTITAQGAITTNAGLTCSSDIRYKKDIKHLPDALTNVIKLQGVNYFWKVNEFPEKHFTETKQIGFIAQELEKIYPEMVFTDDKGYKSVDYSRLTPVLVEAIKEQQKIIESLKESNQGSELKIQNSELKIQKLEAAVEKLMEAAIKEEAKK